MRNSKFAKVDAYCLSAVAPINLPGGTYRLAHDSCHRSTVFWNQALDLLQDEWKPKCSPSKYNIQSFLCSLFPRDRIFHAHTTEVTVYNLYKTINTASTGRIDVGEKRGRRYAKMQAVCEDLWWQWIEINMWSLTEHTLTHCRKLR